MAKDGVIFGSFKILFFKSFEYKSNFIQYSIILSFGKLCLECKNDINKINET